MIEGNSPYNSTRDLTNDPYNNETFKEKINEKINEKIKNLVTGSTELFENYQNEPLNVPYKTTRSGPIYPTAPQAARINRGSSEKTFRLAVSPSAVSPSAVSKKANSLNSTQDPNASQTGL